MQDIFHVSPLHPRFFCTPDVRLLFHQINSRAVICVNNEIRPKSEKGVTVLTSATPRTDKFLHLPVRSLEDAQRIHSASVQLFPYITFWIAPKPILRKPQNPVDARLFSSVQNSGL